MTWQDLREGWFRLVAVWRRQRQERELSEELAFHFAMKMDAGKSADEARRDFGGFEKWKEVCRDIGRWRMVEDFGRDLVLAVHMLRKSPVFTAVALITLTLAMGANTAIFSLLNELLLESLPVPHAERLVSVRDNTSQSLGYPIFKQIEKQSSPLMQTFGFQEDKLEVNAGDGVENIEGQLVSGNYFGALGATPQLGRWIGPDDDRPGTPNGAVAVISDHYWRTRMNSDHDVLGRKIALAHGVLTVIGVMPESFRGWNKDVRPEIFVPLELEPVVDAPDNEIAEGNNSGWILMGARLNPGVSVERANAFLKARSERIFEAATQGDAEHGRRDFFLVAEAGGAGYSFLRVRFRRPMAVVMILVALVLLVACLNLATLQMARAAARGNEISTRFSLGASRSRLIRQLLTESALLAMLGALFGLAASPAFIGFIISILGITHNDSSLFLEVRPDRTVFAFTAGVAVLVALLTGTLPALRATRGGRKANSRGTDRREAWPKILLSLEVAFALVLVTGASLLGLSLFRLHQIPTGFEARGLLFLGLEMHQQPRSGTVLIEAYRDVVAELKKVPGVTAVSMTQFVPVGEEYWRGRVKVAGGSYSRVWRNRVGPDYFQTMKTRLLEGREFRWEDRDAGRKVILSESAARALFPDGHAVGHSILINDDSAPNEVIGVVVDTRHLSLRSEVTPTLYVCAVQNISNGASFAIVLRTAGDQAQLIPAAVKTVQRIVPDIPTPAAFSMERRIAENLASERIMAALALFFGGLALLITGIGLYGTLAYATERRTMEIGIRLALGARPVNVVSMISAENVAIAFVGCVAGVAGAVAASKTIAGFLYGVSARDPVVFGGAALLLMSVAAVASVLPAVRASKIDPIAAIRYE